MRVLQLSDGFPPERQGGAERFCFGLSTWLISAGIEVQIATPSQQTRGEGPPIRPLLKVGPKYLRKLFFDYFSPLNTRRLERIMAEFRPDIVHAHNIYGISSQLLHVASRRAPTVNTLHDYWPIDFFSPTVVNGQLRYPRRQTALVPWVRLHQAIHRRHLRGVTLVSPSRYLAQRLAGASGGQTIRVIPNGIDVPVEGTRYEPIVLLVGRMVPEKGLHTVLPSLEALAQETGWRVDVLGDGPLRSVLERRHRGVQFHGSTDPTPFYQAASIVVVPSVWPENQPYVILEGMSHGLAVLASDVGGISELVEDGRTGLLFESGNPDAFADALTRLTANPSLLKEMGRAARERIAARFTWDSVGQQYLQLYEEVMADVQDRARSS